MLWENRTVKKAVKYIDTNLDTILFCVVVGLIIALIICAHTTGKTDKVNELCNRYNGELPFCQVQRVIYSEHN